MDCVYKYLIMFLKTDRDSYNLNTPEIRAQIRNCKKCKYMKNDKIIGYPCKKCQNLKKYKISGYPCKKCQPHLFDTSYSIF